MEIEDDGLITPEIGAWGEDKYRLVSNYATMFATSMKSKWDCRVYIDFFSGAGWARIKNTNRIIPASPILALDIKDRFDKYIFCEEDKEKFTALEKRVSRGYPEASVKLFNGNTNKLSSYILNEIKSYRHGSKVLCFCFVDPYKLKNLEFDSILRLSSQFIDFLVLIPTHMDANRNISHYIRPTDNTIDNFLGTSSWRNDWEKDKLHKEGFGDFLADQFGNQMKEIGYLYSGLEDTKLVRSTDKNLPLYRLAFFSRNKLGQKFWREAMKYSSDQIPLF